MPGVTLTYVANPTGTKTAAQLATAMAAPTYLPASYLALLGCTLASQVGSVNLGQALLTINLTFTATGIARYPSVVGGIGGGPFTELLTPRVAAAIGQPVGAGAIVHT